MEDAKQHILVSENTVVSNHEEGSESSERSPAQGDATGLIEIVDRTRDLQMYRECLRLVWNVFIRDVFDAEIRFMDVADNILHAMLGSNTGEYNVEVTADRVTYFPLLEVRQNGSARNPSFLTGRLDGGFMRWRSAIWRPTTKLAFASVYDFGGVDGEYMEYRYVRAVVVETSDEDLVVGEAVLVPVGEVALFETERHYSLWKND